MSKQFGGTYDIDILSEIPNTIVSNVICQCFKDRILELSVDHGG